MPTTHVKTKSFQSDVQSPLTPPDGSSLEELVNAFLLTLAQKDVLDVLFSFSQTGKYGTHTTYTAQVVYQG